MKHCARSQKLLFFLLFCLVLAADVFLKLYVHQRIPLTNYPSPFPHGGIGVFENYWGISFSINHVLNKGAAWGTFSSYQTFLLILRIVIVGGMFVYIFIKKLQPLRILAFTLIIAGALGNIVDTFIYGYVIDMFHLQFGSYTYPIFNIADSSIVCGIILMCLDSAIAKRSQSQSERISS